MTPTNRRISFICLIYLLGGPLPGLAQPNLSDSVTLDSSYSTVRQLLQQLESAKQFRLAYSESYLDVRQSVRLRNKTPTVKEILDAIGQATRTTYQVRGNRIIFRKKDAKFTISGYVRDAFSGEDLIGASVWQGQTGLGTSDQGGVTPGTSSNNYGFYSLTLPNDTVRLRCSYVGHASEEIAFVLRQDTVINWNLTDEMLAEVMVTSVAVSPLEQPTLNLPVPVADLLTTPVLFGEVDLLKSLQRLPGVQSGVDGGAGLYVRGSGPDQNLLLLDGVPLYNASHLLGFFSVFNADAINNVNFYKGGFPARYGGRLASVVDVQLREGNREKFQGTGSVGLLSSRLTLEGPLFSNKTSFLVSGRYAHLGLYTWALTRLNGFGEDVSYNFYDLTAKVNHTLSHRNQLYLSTYLGQDRFGSETAFGNQSNTGDVIYTRDVASRESFRWGNTTTALRWNHVYDHRLFSNLTLTYSRYRFRLGEANDVLVTNNGVSTRSFTDKVRVSDIRDWAGRIDYDYLPAPRHHLRFGGGLIHHTFRPGSVTLAYRLNDRVAVDTAYDASVVGGAEADLFIEDEITLSRTLTANLGARLTGFWVDRTFYAVGQPRLSVQYQPASSTTWNVSYSRMSQFMHLLTNPTINLPTDLWLPTTEQLPPETARQWAVAYQRKLKGPYEIQVEAYFKDMRNVVEYKEGEFDVYEDILDWEDRIASGRGRSYGLELLAQRTEGRLSGWLGYTLSRSERRFEEINEGQWFPFRYDRRHEIDFGGVFRWKERVDVSWGWGFSSGLAVTLPEVVFMEKPPVANPNGGYYDYRDNLLLGYGPRNSQRTRAIHRLDVSISFRKPTRWGERTWEFGLYNLYSRRNPFSVVTDYWGGDGDQVNYQFYQRSLFPIVPSVSYRFKF